MKTLEINDFLNPDLSKFINNDMIFTTEEATIKDIKDIDPGSPSPPTDDKKKTKEKIHKQFRKIDKSKIKFLEFVSNFENILELPAFIAQANKALLLKQLIDIINKSKYYYRDFNNNMIVINQIKDIYSVKTYQGGSLIGGNFFDDLRSFTSKLISFNSHLDGLEQIPVSIINKFESTNMLYSYFYSRINLSIPELTEVELANLTIAEINKKLREENNKLREEEKKKLINSFPTNSHSYQDTILPLRMNNNILLDTTDNKKITVTPVEWVIAMSKAICLHKTGHSQNSKEYTNLYNKMVKVYIVTIYEMLSIHFGNLVSRLILSLLDKYIIDKLFTSINSKYVESDNNYVKIIKHITGIKHFDVNNIDGILNDVNILFIFSDFINVKNQFKLNIITNLLHNYDNLNNIPNYYTLDEYEIETFRNKIKTLYNNETSNTKFKEICNFIFNKRKILNHYDIIKIEKI
jgi:ribosomal protein L17